MTWRCASASLSLKVFGFFFHNSCTCTLKPGFAFRLKMFYGHSGSLIPLSTFWHYASPNQTPKSHSVQAACAAIAMTVISPKVGKMTTNWTVVLSRAWQQEGWNSIFVFLPPVRNLFEANKGCWRRRVWDISGQTSKVNCWVGCLVSEGITVWKQFCRQRMYSDVDGAHMIRTGDWKGSENQRDGKRRDMNS